MPLVCCISYERQALVEGILYMLDLGCILPFQWKLRE